MLKKIFLLLYISLSVTGCIQQDMLDKFIPQEEVEFSKQYIALFQSNDFDSIETKINPELKNEQLRIKLKQLADFFPQEEPNEIKVVGSHTFKTTKFEQAKLTFQYTFPNKLLLVTIVLHKQDDVLLVNAINVAPLNDSLENINKFTFSNKTIINYIFFTLAIIIPLFIIFALVLCVKTPIPKRKWLWIIFILFGFVRININWTTSGIFIQPISVILFGSGFWQTSMYAPVIISISIPLGAIIFMIKRKQFISNQILISGKNTLRDK